MDSKGEWPAVNHNRRFVGASLALGATAVGIAAAQPGWSLHIRWFVPALYVSTFVLLTVAAAICATDTWVRADRRALPFAAAVFTIGILWLANVPSVSHTQTTAALFALAHTATPLMLLLATLWAREERLPRPGRAIRLSLFYAAVTAAGLIGLTVAVAPQMPAFSVHSSLTTFGQLVIVGATLPLLLTIGASRGADGVGYRTRGPLLGALILLVFEAGGSLAPHPRYTAAWYALAALRFAAFSLITFGELRLYAFTALGERRRAEDLDLIHGATRRIGSSLNPATIAGELSIISEAALSKRLRTQVSARVLQVDGPVVSVFAADAVSSDGETAASFGLHTDPVVASAIDSGLPVQDHSTHARLVVPLASGNSSFGVLELATETAQDWERIDTLSLIQGLADVAALALVNAETFDDLQAAEAYNRAVLMAMSDAFISVTPEGSIVGWNTHATTLLGWGASQVLGRNLIDTVVPTELRTTARSVLKGYLDAGEGDSSREPYELEVMSADGIRIPVEASVWRVESGDSPRLCILARDIAARKAEVETLTRRATHDPLTALPNREFLMEQLTDALNSTNRRRELVGAVFVDLDGFKTVNDTHGHESGDRLLESVAFRLRNCVRPSDVVGRLGGDEFLVVCRGLRNADEVDEVARRLGDELADPIDLDGVHVTVRGGAGTAVAQPGTCTAHDLVRLADEDMYRHKHSRRILTLDPEPAPAPV